MRAGFSLIFILAAAAALAQQQATLTGTVSDDSGAVVAGVSITLRHPESGETYRATSNEIGSYTIPFIKPGAYQLEAQARGFKKYTQSNLRLDTAAHTRADIRLEVGEVNETVTVQAEAPLLKTENSSVGVVIQNKTIASMPLLGRRAAQLVRLSASSSSAARALSSRSPAGAATTRCGRSMAARARTSCWAWRRSISIRRSKLLKR